MPYSPPTSNTSVIIPEPTAEELGLWREMAIDTIGHDLKDGRMMAGLGDLFIPTAALAAAVFHANGIPPRLRQYIGLRTTKLLNSAFPWAPNVRVAANVGVSPEEIEALTTDGPVTTGLDEEGLLLVRAVDEMTLQGTLTDATLTELRNRYENEICRKYILLMSWYNLFMRFCNGCRVAVESPEEVEEKIGGRSTPV